MYDRLALSNEQNLELVRRLPINLKKVNRNKVTAHCPFHKDKTPSFGIDLQRGIYNCFSCGKSGTLASLAYELVHKGARSLLQLDPDTVTEVNQLNGIARGYYVPPTPEEQIEEYCNRKPPEVKGRVVSWRDSLSASNYIKYRDIKPEVADAWGFQYAYHNQFYVESKEDPEEMDGLIIKDRLAVPIRFGRKILSYELRGLQPGIKPKVLYSGPSDYLYRYSFLDKTKPVYLVEGLIDAARLYPYLSNVTYSFGVSMTSLKVHLLKTFPEVIVIPDNDAPGYSLIDTLITEKINTSVLPIPLDYEDAGDTLFTQQYIMKWLKTTKPFKATPENVESKIQYFKTMTSSYRS